MREGAWCPANRRINSYEINHYLVEHFGRIPLGSLGTFEIQVWLSKLATIYSQPAVRHCCVNIRSITRKAKRLNFLATDPGLDVTMAQLDSELHAEGELGISRVVSEAPDGAKGRSVVRLAVAYIRVA